MNVFDRTRELITEYKKKHLGGRALYAVVSNQMLKIVNQVESEYLKEAKQPTLEHPIPLDTQMYIEELEEKVYLRRVDAMEQFLDNELTKYEYEFLSKAFVKLELSGRTKKEQLSTLLHEVIRLAILADEHIM